MGGTRKRGAGKGETGFTLVELMVVLVIIGLAAAVVVVSMPETGGSLESEAEHFAARARAARDGAIVDARPASLAIGAGGYDFARRADGAWQSGVHHDWAAGTRVAATGVLGARTRFDSTGTADPLRVILQRGATRIAIEIGNDGSIQIRR